MSDQLSALILDLFEASDGTLYRLHDADSGEMIAYGASPVILRALCEADIGDAAHVLDALHGLARSNEDGDGDRFAAAMLAARAHYLTPDGADRLPRDGGDLSERLPDEGAMVIGTHQGDGWPILYRTAGTGRRWERWTMLPGGLGSVTVEAARKVLAAEAEGYRRRYEGQEGQEEAQ